MLKRRYEMLLPLKFNDGRAVPDDILNQTREDLVNRFGAVLVQPDSILGVWVQEGERYEDALVRLFVDVDDTASHREFFQAFKETLKQRFDQLEIYIASYSVDIL